MRCARCVKSLAVTVRTADFKALCTTLCREIPHHRSVNTDDLFHTLPGLFTTLLLPSRQMFLNKHYHSDAMRANKRAKQWGHKDSNIHRQKHAMRQKKAQKQEGKQRVWFQLLFKAPHCSDSLHFPVEVEVCVWSSIVFLQGAIKHVVPCFSCQEW